MKKIIIFLPLFLFLSSAFSSTADDLSGYVGWTIMANKTIEGWYDKGGKHGDDFEGCDYDRVIIFSDNTVLKCAGYSYQYSYRPKAIILVKGYQFIMIVGNDVYRMNR